MSAQAAERDLAAVIGLEVHVQLETDTKIFCGCSTDTADADPNTHTCPVCLGLPGALPVLNEGAVEAAVKLGKAIDADIPERTRFHRKNYFYPDLPKGFQITQYDAPVCQDGELEVGTGDDRRAIGIERAHLEEDPGSLQHVGGSIEDADHTLVDYNRAGTPLMEIVTRPDFREAEEVRAFLAKLTEVLEYLGIFDAERDGSLRVDANISMVDSEELAGEDGPSDEVLESANRTEVKNISSHRAAQKALAYEITRQRNQLERGMAVEQETRHWDEARGVTVSMRSKEEEKDYRYFREADIPPLEVSDWKEEIPIPELPDARRERFQTEYGVGGETASKLTSRKAVADLFEELADEYDADLAATWVADNILGELNYRDLSLDDVADRYDEFERLVELVAEDEITSKNAEEVVLRSMLDEDRDPDDVVESEGLGKTSGDAVADAVAEAIEENPDAVADYHDGESDALNFLVGQVMAKTGGSADPGQVNELLREELA
ncbi:Asp-tRNA(Asn)/Glu-tRNA(Gln) amidotransferase subunit GatB [Halobacterium jilantaiense]|uniref:Aspartyl/glutamyl-tRNA(Asn/Gln) amidotransferase subunit B n=1 Tax=Halobacterium jilantaiense TaxID=355548 RepID=A0A1I0NWV7_9EURY|nr:Asp-tRNA(Asn)/Glu-tRNA(Gln) amidotransferase subunit GatB [Halobacterium jilantaiense]SEW05990.1 aspartyl/glutamyl-tRNA(Asn/Gln) amidotransferase subunit B [Halobacterium jilantaiense]